MTLTSPLLPAVAMVLVTAAVWCRLYVVRIGEMRERRMSAQSLATARNASELLQRVGPADNFKNLFEVPVLFYSLCLAIAVTQLNDMPLTLGSWLFVLLRAVHSYVHCTYNNVMHRFAAYATSSVLLFLMWAYFGARLLSSSAA